MQGEGRCFEIVSDILKSVKETSLKVVIERLVVFNGSILQFLQRFCVNSRIFLLNPTRYGVEQFGGKGVGGEGGAYTTCQ